VDKTTPISEVVLETKPYKALVNLGVNTVGDFLSLDLDTVLELSGIGTGTKERLAFIKEHILSSLEKEEFKPMSLIWPSIYERLSVRTLRGLKALHIDTPEEFVALSSDRFLSLRGVGITCWKEVHRYQKELAKALLHSEQTSQTDEISDCPQAYPLQTVRKELGSRQHIIDDLGIQSFDQLLKLRYEDITSLKSVGPVAWTKLQSSIQKALSIQKLISQPNSTDIQLENFPIFGGVGIGHRPVPESFYPDTSIDNLTLSSRIRSVMTKLSINTLRSLLMTSPERLLKQGNFGETSLMLLRQSIRDYLDYCNTSGGAAVDTGKSLSEFLRILCKLSNQSERVTNILIARIGGFSGSTKTLEELAEEYGNTREMIRQIVKVSTDRIEQTFQARVILNVFLNVIQQILNDYRGIIGLGELGDEIVHRLNWNANISKESLQHIFKLFTMKDNITVLDDSIMCFHLCRECPNILNHLHELIKVAPFGTLSLTALTDNFLLCAPTPDRGCPTNNNLKYSEQFFIELSKRANLFCDEKNVYTAQAWSLKYRGVNAKVEAVLDLLAKPSTPVEISDYFTNVLHDPIPQEKVHTSLINAENSFVWGRGEYIYKSHVHIDHDVLFSLKNILMLKLHDVSFIALYGIFQEFRITFTKAGIPNDYALGTVITLYLNEFHVDRYHYVYLNEPSKSTSIDHYIEQWILDQGSEVKRSDLEKWMTNQIGVRESLIQLSLGRLNNIFVTQKGNLIHVDNTGLDMDKLAPLSEWVKNILEHNSYIGVKKLFDEQKITCFQLGIVSEQMLYDVMRYFYSDKYDFPKYPHICRQDQDSFNSLGQLMTEYIKEQNTIVSIDKCIDYFETKGYSPQQMQARLYYLQIILPYYSNCVVHSDIIGWNTEKAIQLYQTLSQAYESRRKLGYLTGDLEDVYDRYEDQLPQLANDLSWTGELIAALAARTNDVKIIGNAKRAYSLEKYPGAISSLADLVVIVVRDHFGGGCSREQMNQWMRDNGIVRKQLTPEMFSMLPGLVVTEHEYLWEGRNADV
jgi:hypothetical protein